MAERVGHFENRAFTQDEHHEWALKLWNRIDRDGGGTVTREELNCEEFQDVLRSVVCPENEGHVGNYGRSEMHMEQALDFLLRKTHVNGDGSLSFKEFKSFMRILRNQGDEGNRVHLIFALFDLDGSNTIDKEEFAGIYAFFSGHQATKAEIEKAFLQMDKFDKKEVTRNQFIKWLKTDAPRAFRQETAAVDQDQESNISSSKSSSAVKAKKIHRPAPGMFQPRSKEQHESTWSNTWKANWNERFRGRDHVLMNPTCQPGLRHYFSAPQTLPELDRFYGTYKGFGKAQKRLHEPRPPPRNPVLSTDAKTMDVNVERALPGGTQRNHKGALILWDNEWPDKACDFSQKVWPASLMLRCQKPPPLLVAGREVEHALYRAALVAEHGRELCDYRAIDEDPKEDRRNAVRAEFAAKRALPKVPSRHFVATL